MNTYYRRWRLNLVYTTLIIPSHSLAEYHAAWAHVLLLITCLQQEFLMWVLILLWHIRDRMLQSIRVHQTQFL